MYPCRIQSKGAKLKIKNDCAVKNSKFIWSFESGPARYLSVQTQPDKAKYRVTLLHKVSGERLHFRSPFITFRREEPLKKDLPRVITNEQSTPRRGLKENKVQQVNIDTEKTITIVKTEKQTLDIDFNLNTSLMENTLECTFDEITNDLLKFENKEIQLSKIAPEEVLRALSNKAKLLVNKKSSELEDMVRDNTLNQTVLSVIKKLLVNDSKKIQICLLLDYMITFYKLTLKSIRARNPIQGCPNTVEQFLLKSYTKTTTENNKTLIYVSKEEKETLLVMILALLCYLNDYSFQLTELQNDLKCSVDRLKKHLQILDVTVTRATKMIGHDASSKDFIASTKTPFVLDS